MYELIILSLLMRVPMHGYLIAHIISDIIGPYAKLSNGRLYPLLARLEESRLIEIDEEAAKEQHGKRTSRSYRITEAGRKRFHTLMMDTTSNPGEYQRIFLQKVTMFHFLLPSERFYLIDHYINYCRAHVLHLIAKKEYLAEGNYHRYEGGEWVLPAKLDVMTHMASQWQQEISWALHLRKQELRYHNEDDPVSEYSAGAELVEHAYQDQDQNEKQDENEKKR